MNLHYAMIGLRLLAVTAAAASAFLFIFYVSTFTYPFIIGFMLALIINPAVNFIEKKGRLPRGAAVLAVLILTFAVIAALITLLVAEIVSGTSYLAAVVPRHFEDLVVRIEQFIAGEILPLYNQLTVLFNKLDSGQQATILKNIQSVGNSLANSVGELIKSSLGNIPELLKWLPNAASVLIFSLMATFFISKDWQKISSIGQRFFPEKARRSGRDVFNDLQKALFGFVKAQTTLISITTIIVLAGLIILRVEYAITIALIIGLVDLIPYLGTGLVFVPWIAYSILAGDASLGIGLGVLYTVVIVQRQLMEPKILSSTIGLDPLATLIALFAGFKLLGFFGLIAGPVLLVIFKTLQDTGVIADLRNYIIGK